MQRLSKSGLMKLMEDDDKRMIGRLAEHHSVAQKMPENILQEVSNSSFDRALTGTKDVT